MDKSTRNLLIGIGVLSILSSIYMYVNKGTIFDNFAGILVGISLIVVAISQHSKKQ